MRHALPALLLLLVIGSGCVTTAERTPTTAEPPAGDVNPPSATPTGVAETLDLASSGTSCDADLYVEFWGLNEDHLWGPGVVRVSYYAPPNTSFLMAVYLDGTVRGAAYERNAQDGGVNVDGAKLKLDALLSGEHVVQVVIYRDGDGNGRLDPDVDSPCLNDGTLVKTPPVRVNFSRFN